MTTSEIQFLKSTLKLKVNECTALREQIRQAEAKTTKPKPAAKPTTTARKAVKAK